MGSFEGISFLCVLFFLSLSLLCLNQRKEGCKKKGVDGNDGRSCWNTPFRFGNWGRVSWGDGATPFGLLFFVYLGGNYGPLPAFVFPPLFFCFTVCALVCTIAIGAMIFGQSQGVGVVYFVISWVCAFLFFLFYFLKVALLITKIKKIFTLLRGGGCSDLFFCVCPCVSSVNNFWCARGQRGDKQTGRQTTQRITNSSGNGRTKSGGEGRGEDCVTCGDFAAV